eukprot:Gb_29678 [translate_table: standard]
MSNQRVSVEMVKDATGLDKVVLKEPRGASSQVHLFGGQVTSWKNDRGEELLFTSSKEIFKLPKEIRGGIPICFPQFGGCGSLEQHVDLILKPTEEDLKIWPHCFEFRLRVALDPGRDLTLIPRIRNIDSKPFTFTFASHTYFSISIRVCRDQITRQSLGYAYVNYSNAQDANCTQELLNFSNVSGKPMRIMFSHRDPSIQQDCSNGTKLFQVVMQQQVANSFQDSLYLCSIPENCSLAVEGFYGFVWYLLCYKGQKIVAVVECIRTRLRHTRHKKGISREGEEYIAEMESRMAVRDRGNTPKENKEESVHAVRRRVTRHEVRRLRSTDYDDGEERHHMNTKWACGIG